MSFKLLLLQLGFTWVSGRFAYRSFRPRSVRLRIESIRLSLICQFAYEIGIIKSSLYYSFHSILDG